MTTWRMAFRCGTNGHEMWPACRRAKVAVIEYSPVDNIDLSKCPERKLRAAWSKLWPAQQEAFLFDMKQDYVIIYVKEGPWIVGKGLVVGGYFFDKKSRIKDPYGVPWQHQHEVRWLPFPSVQIQLGRRQCDRDVQRVERAAAKAR